MQWFFARRYLFSRSSHSVINIIAGVSLVSVAIPVAAMIILLSVFNGFESLIKRMYATTDADIEISRIESPTSTLRQQILDTEGVAAASFVVEGQALVRYEKRETAVLVRGVDSHYFDVLPLDSNLLQGTFESHKALITKDVAQLLAMYTAAGSNISLHTISGSKVGSMLPVQGIRSEQLAVGAIIRSSQQVKGMIITPLATTEKLFGADKTKIMFAAQQAARALKRRCRNIFPRVLKSPLARRKMQHFIRLCDTRSGRYFLLRCLFFLSPRYRLSERLLC